MKQQLRTCEKGHQYYKSSDCPVCLVCEGQRVAEADFLKELPAPARRALENAGIRTLKQLSKKTEQEILKLHGMGPASVPKLRQALATGNLSFKHDF